MKRIDRIKYMEDCLNASKSAVGELLEAVEKYEKAQNDIKTLSNYYGSLKWMEDHDADERGKLPDDLPRGVLSEDGVYNLIIDHHELMTKLSAIVAFAVKEKLV